MCLGIIYYCYSRVFLSSFVAVPSGDPSACAGVGHSAGPTAMADGAGLVVRGCAGL